MDEEQPVEEEPEPDVEPEPDEEPDDTPPVTTAPQVAAPGACDRGRKKLTDEEKVHRRKETQARYYQKSKAKPPEPPPLVRQAPKAPKPKPRVPREREEPRSPREVLVAAYREARIAQRERKREKYKSWFD